MAGKLIPNSDSEFKDMAQAFSANISRNPSRFSVSDSDSQLLTEAFEQFLAAFMANSNPSQRSKSTTLNKTEARARLEKIIQKIAHQVRNNESISSADKASLFIKERPTKLSRKRVPMEPPKLRFMRAVHTDSGAFPMHELKFAGINSFNKAKPDGAVRLELFVDLVPPNEPIPAYPGANHGGRPWYLRSFTRSPILLTPPMARVPMRVVYWARWADSSGETGPFSATAVGWIEQGTEHRIMQFGNEKHHKPVAMIEVDATDASRPNDSTYSIEVIQARYTSYLPNKNPIDVTINHAALPAPVDEETEAA